MPWPAALALLPFALVPALPAPAPIPFPTTSPSPEYVAPDVPPPPVLRLERDRIQVIQRGRPSRDVPLPKPAGRDGEFDLATLPGLLAGTGQPELRRLASTEAGGGLTLHATLDQQAGTKVRGGPPSLTRLDLGPGARLLGQHADLTLDGVNVQAGASSMADVGATLSYRDDSHVTLAGTTLDGTQPSPATEQDGIQLSGGGDLRLTGVAVTGADTGIELDGVGSAELRDVTVEYGSGPGIVVRRAGSLRLQRVLTRGDVGVGLSLRGPIGALDTGTVRSVGNQGPGVWLERLNSLTVTDLNTAGNTGPGTELTGSRSVDLAGVHSENDLIGLAVTGSSVVSVGDLSTLNSATGVAIANSSRVGLTHALISSAGSAAVDQDADATGVTLTDVRTTGNRTPPAPRRHRPWILVLIAVVIELDLLRSVASQRVLQARTPLDDYQIRTR